MQYWTNPLAFGLVCVLEGCGQSTQDMSVDAVSGNATSTDPASMVDRNGGVEAKAQAPSMTRTSFDRSPRVRC